MVSLSEDDRLWHMPHEDSSFGSHGHNGLLVRSNADLADVSGVPNTSVIRNTLIVVPQLHSLVLAAGHEVLSSLGDGQSVDFSGLGSIKHSNGLTIEAVPVSDLSVAAGGEHLGLIRVVKYLFEHGRFEQAHHSGVVDDVPDDAGAVVGGGHGLGVLGVDLDV